MIAKVLHKHIDGMDELEARVQEDIDIIFSTIDKKKLINDPEGTLQEVAIEIENILKEKYMPMAAQDGFDLLKLLNRYDAQGKEIPIDPSKDPNKNEAIVQ